MSYHYGGYISVRYIWVVFLPHPDFLLKFAATACVGGIVMREWFAQLFTPSNP